MNFKKFWEKIIFSPNKMFSIFEDGKKRERTLFYSIQQASEETGIPPEEIDKVLQKGGGRYFSQKDKKVFWISENDCGIRFVRIGKEDFPDAASVMARFGLSRDDVIYQLCDEKRKFFDSQGEYDQISFRSSSLVILIDALKQAKMTEKLLVSLPPSEAHEKAKSLIEEIEKLF